MIVDISNYNNLYIIDIMFIATLLVALYKS